MPTVKRSFNEHTEKEIYYNQGKQNRKVQITEISDLYKKYIYCQKLKENPQKGKESQYKDINTEIPSNRSI